ncbi:dynamin family protein [Metabacillus sp. HB246100]
MIIETKSEELLQKIILLHEKMRNRDEQNAIKLLELANKFKDKKLYVAFAGHFSAGKSSMINKLLDEQILPTSPIPTSANLVLLETGENQVTLFTKNKEKIHLNNEYTVEQVKEYCKQGDDVERISIQKPYERLTKDVVIMDTPGIDSTDHAHKQSTESMLHLADVIFYVTDYNHVQSEENLHFISEMKKREKVVFLIVNQIDKHEEKEVSFNHFQEQIFTSFEEMDLNRKDIFFTTLKEDTHPRNELETVQELIKAVIEQKDKQIEKNLFQSIKFIIKDHLIQNKEEKGIEQLNVDELIEEMNVHTKNKESAQELLQLEKEKIKNIKINLEEKMESILKSANLIPYETRELVASYLQSLEPSFKVGFIFSKGKTELEKENRKNDLYQSLKKNLETQILWHLQPLVKELVESYQIIDSSIISKVQNFTINIEKEILKEAFKEGASYNNQYILTYSSDVSDVIKRRSKQEVLLILEKILDSIKQERQQIIEEHELNLCNIEKEMISLQSQIDAIQEHVKYEHILEKIIEENQSSLRDVTDWLAENQLYIQSEKKIELLNIEKEDTDYTEDFTQKTEDLSDHQDLFIEKTEQLLASLDFLQGFNQISQLLKSKVSNFKKKSYTVALFGAFSAGKSSFANALIGDRLLPSSPTPTTATINKIAPTTSEKYHGLVEVLLKDEHEIREDILELIPSLNLVDQPLSKVIEILNGKSGENDVEHEMIKKYKEALPTYSTLSKNGLVVQSNKDSLKEFVAKEQVACLVKEVIVYYDCEITKAGITLVDTPGADSLHKRHTEVAFQYIKKADAILYVTYYNHPFSKGDREFLRQLGRVKDSFTLDKMFFIINAIDLAKDKEEVKLVKNYIREQFLLHEIRNVRLYGVSSLNVLERNFKKEEDYAHFQNQFQHFIQNDLSSTAILSIKEDLRKFLNRIESLIEAAKQDEVIKKNEAQKLIKEKKDVLHELTQLTSEHISTSVSQEIKELLFYVKQRVFFRFNDFFKEAFHPGMFQQVNSTQQALEKALQELNKRLEFELVQELQATTLRIEKVIYKNFKSEGIKVTKLIQKHSDSIAISIQDPKEIQTPKIDVIFNEDHISLVKSSLKYFKNVKAFFEKNEKKMMSEDMEKKFDEPISEILNQHLRLFAEFYHEIITQLHIKLLLEMKEQLNEAYDSFINIQTVDIDMLLKQQALIKETIELVKEPTSSHIG